MNAMLPDIQKRLNQAGMTTDTPKKTYIIPREYVVPNNRIEIDGQGSLQRLLAAYRDKKSLPRD